MSQFFDRVKNLVKNTSHEQGTADPARIIRLVIAAVLLVVALVLKIPAFVRVILLVLSAVVSGYDIVLAAIDAVMKKDFFSSPVLVLFVTVLAFPIGFPGEAAAYILLYQLCLLALNYVRERTKQSALDLVRGESSESLERIQELVDAEGAGETELEHTVGHSASLVLKAAIVLAVVYAIVLPFIGSSFRTSIHRALMIIAVCTPLSVVVSMPLTAIIGQCFAARQGVVFNKSLDMERAAHAETAVFDKAGIFSEQEPTLLAVKSDIIDQDTLMNFAAHAVYYSEQPVARAISAAYDQEYRLDVISDFSEIPGNGVEVKIAGNLVLLATADYLASRGVRVPREKEPGQVFYLVVADRYVGKVLISAGMNEAAKDLAEGMREAGLKRCVLFTEDGAEVSQRTAEALEFDEVFGECDTEKKLKLLSTMSEGSDKGLLYIYTNGFEAHSAADVDMRVSKKAKFADATVDTERVANLPFAVQICRRTGEVAAENAIIAFVVKAILIFLAINGKSAIWFALFVDMAAGIGTLLNAIRVTRPSLFAGAKGEKE